MVRGVKVDVAIIGSGPAGLATAIGAAQRGLGVHVFDKQAGSIDKACGEGLMPSGLAALERLGALSHLDMTDTAPFESIVYVQEDGTRAVGKRRVRQQGAAVRLRAGCGAKI